MEKTRIAELHEGLKLTKETIATELYNEAYYASRDENTRSAAKKIIAHLTTMIEFPRTVVDFGCGVGTWLSVLKDGGAASIKGYDGPWVDLQQLVIPRACFSTALLGKDVIQCEACDLAICLEVAEHLEVVYADRLIETLTSSSDVVLFSAAIPGQGGTNHVNEQWPSYWVSKFNQFQFDCYDVLREFLWEEESVPFWYRQNLFAAVRAGRHDLAKPFMKASRLGANKVLSLVHPILFDHRLRFNASQVSKWQASATASDSIRGSARKLLSAINRRIGVFHSSVNAQS